MEVMSRIAIAALFAVTFVAAAPVNAQQVTTSPQRSGVPEVETVGTGQRRVAPDRATVTLFVESKAATAAAAAAQNARDVQRVRDTLRVAGLDSAVATASYHVGPNFEPDTIGRAPRRTGYVARTSLRVQLRRLDHV